MRFLDGAYVRTNRLKACLPGCLQTFFKAVMIDILLGLILYLSDFKKSKSEFLAERASAAIHTHYTYTKKPLYVCDIKACDPFR